MTYATPLDVAALLPPLQAGGMWYAPLTVAQVDALGAGIDAEINAALTGAGFSVPVTSPASAVDYLKAVETWGWAAAIQRSRYRDVQSANTEGAWKFWQDKYAAALKGLKEWAEATLGAEAGILPGSYTLRYPDADVSQGANADARIPVDFKW